MKLLSLLVLSLGLATLAKADTVTSGTLAFTCEPFCDIGNNSATAPTAGTFSFDNTTGTFLTFSVSWNGTTYGQPIAGFGENIFDALFGQGPLVLGWMGECEGGIGVEAWPAVSCANDNLFVYFLKHKGTGVEGLWLPAGSESRVGPTTFANDFADGTIFVDDPVVTTPEPSSFFLTLLGMLAMVICADIWLARRSLWNGRD